MTPEHKALVARLRARKATWQDAIVAMEEAADAIEALAAENEKLRRADDEYESLIAELRAKETEIEALAAKLAEKEQEIKA